MIGSLVSRNVGRLVEKRTTKHHQAIIRRVFFYLVFIIFSMAGLREAGFSLEVVLGAAGILTVAIGFASQTSASNIISGLFLVMEKPFEIGDMIEVDATAGEVIAIDLLSVKIRTPDNLFVRVPNETLIKSRRSEEHTSELQSRPHLVCRLLLEKKKKNKNQQTTNDKIITITMTPST